ncbi:MAG TPA: hypothetical protein VFN37_10450 [Candidatus Baltobacteraceae bacterium]|nr:hypothetical protein [Candidatus Baltobacteraceae bacterium]
MRLMLLALIFLLVLTLGNAWLMKRERSAVAAHDYAPLQITQPHARKYEWDAFIWREIGALVLTVLVFGTVASQRRR